MGGRAGVLDYPNSVNQMDNRTRKVAWTQG